MNFLKSLLGKSKIDDLIEGYEIFLPPNNKNGSYISVVEAEENLKWFLDVKNERLKNLNDRLNKLGIFDISFNNEKTEIIERYFNNLFKNELVKYKKFQFEASPGWSDREIENQMPSIGFLTDVAILCGDIIISKQNMLAWGVDLDSFSVKNKSTTLGRLVLFTPADLAASRPAIALDVRSWVIESMWEIARNRKSRGFLRKNYFKFMTDSIGGGYHRFF